MTLNGQEQSPDASKRASMASRPAVRSPEDSTPPDMNYDQLVWSAGRAALIVFSVKVATVIILAKTLGAPTKLSFWLGVIPHLAFSTDEATFRTIVTWSTIAMATTALLLAAVTVARTTTRDRQRMWGRLVAGIVALETLGLQLWRQRSGGTPVQWQWSWLVVVTGCAGIALLAIPLWTQRGDQTQHDQAQHDQTQHDQTQHVRQQNGQPETTRRSQEGS